MSVTAHCLVKNEENFILYAITSVVDFVDAVIIFDTGSTDKTVDIIKNLVQKYPHKIFFEEKGECDKAGHTKLRQEMVEKTKTDWFMVLDGDEVWTKRGMQEAIDMLQKNTAVECVMAPFYLLVGDIFHKHYKSGSIEMLGKKDFFYPRFFKMLEGLHWQGDYNQDAVYNSRNEIFFNKDNTVILTNRFWHATHLVRSSIDTDFSSGGRRSDKLINTYFLIGRKINESAPEVFQQTGLPFFKSFINFWPWLAKKIFH
ncbi:MAG: glycosyltransferase [Candidatus Magasanikbacteria bacterium]|nr:glycosyltransferase [Candidatus Magasanikbacteria bacterium]